MNRKKIKAAVEAAFDSIAWTYNGVTCFWEETLDRYFKWTDRHPIIHGLFISLIGSFIGIILCRNMLLSSR